MRPHAPTIATIAGLLLLAAAGCRQATPEPEKTRLRLFCGAGIREPVAELAQQFSEANGVRVEADYAGSNILLARIRERREGDLYVPGDREYIRRA